MNAANLAAASQLCTCTNGCTYTCVVCTSPPWAGKQCIRQLWQAHAASAEGARAAARFNNMMTDRPLDDTPALVEKVIDFADELMGGIEPWQAQMLRAIFS